MSGGDTSSSSIERIHNLSLSERRRTPGGGVDLVDAAGRALGAGGGAVPRRSSVAVVPSNASASLATAAAAAGLSTEGLPDGYSMQVAPNGKLNLIRSICAFQVFYTNYLF